MHYGRRIWAVPLVSALFFLGAVGLADSELPSETIATEVPSGGDALDTGTKGIKRDCVLLEVFMRPT
jgi:hypothetical protein